MALDQPTNPQTTDQPDPAQARADFDAALDRSVRDWAEKARQVEIVRARNLALSETNDAIEALRRLRDIGLEHAERTSREGRGLLTFAEQDACVKTIDPGLKFNRIARAVRQIVVLQQELLGNRPVAGVRAAADTQPQPAEAVSPKPAAEREPRAERSDLPDGETADYERPDRNDLNDLYDYDDRSYGEVVADVRQVLSVSPTEPGLPASKTPAPHKPFKPRTRLTASASALGANARGRGPP